MYTEKNNFNLSQLTHSQKSSIWQIMSKVEKMSRIISNFPLMEVANEINNKYNNLRKVSEILNYREISSIFYSLNIQEIVNNLELEDTSQNSKSNIITDINVINNYLLSEVKNNTENIYKLTPRQFEQLMAELFEKAGYEVKLTQQTRDGGKDLIIMVKQEYIGNFLIYADCKKYAPHRPVGVGLIKELYGTINADNVNSGLVITTSYFSPDAKEFTKTIKNRMRLMDYEILKEWIEKI